MSKLLFMISELLIGSQSYLLKTGIFLEQVIGIFLFSILLLAFFNTETRNYVGFSFEKEKAK